MSWLIYSYVCLGGLMVLGLGLYYDARDYAQYASRRTWRAYYCQYCQRVYNRLEGGLQACECCGRAHYPLQF